jgi:gliding motility-associated protein GldC
MNTSQIQIDITTDENKVPSKIHWSAEDSEVSGREAKAMALAMWDDKDGNAVHMDLWTKEMSVEEMRHFICQTMMTMANTLERATNDKAHADAVRSFAEELAKRLDVLKD